jgi:hypothetical protein
MKKTDKFLEAVEFLRDSECTFFSALLDQFTTASLGIRHMTLFIPIIQKIPSALKLSRLPRLTAFNVLS